MTRRFVDLSVPLENGVRVTGIDAWSWDAPFPHTRRKYE